MSQIDQFISDFASFVWGFPLLILLVGGGLFLLIMSKMISFRYLFHSINILRGKYDDEGDYFSEGCVSTVLERTFSMRALRGS